MNSKDDGSPMPSDGAPIDLQAGAHINRIYGEISELRKEQVEQGKALSRIEGILSEQKEERNKATTLKTTIIVSIVTFASAVVSAAMLFKK